MAKGHHWLDGHEFEQALGFDDGQGNLACFWSELKIEYLLMLLWRVQFSSVQFSHSVVSKAPLSMGFPRQEYWSGLSFPSLQDLPDPGIELESLSLAGGFFTDELPGKSTWTRCVVVQSLGHVRLFVTHGLQHARLLCPSLFPGVCSNSCPLSQWCHPTISYSVAPFSSCPQSFPASGYFPMTWLFSSSGQCMGASASASVLPMSIQDWFPLGLPGLISLKYKGLSRVFFNTSVQKHQFFGTQFSLQSNSHPYMTTRKTIALTRQTLLVMSLLFNTLSWL